MSDAGERSKLDAVRAAFVVLALVVASPAPAEPAALATSLACRPEAAPGRVLCELKYSVAPGARLAWADALVTDSPAFARPLRSRVTPERFKEASPLSRQLSLGFVASEAGVGRVTVKARAVVCRGAGERELCRPQSQDVHAEIRVGG